MDLELDGKVALVTGGSRGIGKAIAMGLASEGCDVALLARTIGPLEEAAGDIEKATGRARHPRLIAAFPVGAKDGIYRYLVSRVDECRESGVGAQSEAIPRPNAAPCAGQDTEGP